MDLTWVIGGTSGIGEAVCDLLRDNGSPVLATDQKDADVRSEDALRRFWEEHGPNKIVYCAGVNALSFNKDIDMEVVQDLFDVNVFGFIRLAKLLAGARVVSDPIRLVVITSDAATRPMRTSLAYNASKAALSMAIKQVARENAPDIIVNGVAPGMTAPTRMSQYIDETVPVLRGWSEESARDYERSQIPAGRRGTPMEVAQVIYNLLFHAPTYQIGSIIEVNGGRS